MVTLSFRCVEPCKKEFTTQRGLTKHQDTCALYSHVTGAELLEAIQMEEEAAAKRPRLDFQSSHNIGEASCLDFEGQQLDVIHDIPGNLSAHFHDKQQDTITSPHVRRASPTPTEELGRGKRTKRRTKRYIDHRPEDPAPLPEPEDLNASTPQFETINIPQKCTTARNANGLFREYVSRPSYVPDDGSYELELHSEELEQAGIEDRSEIRADDSHVDIEVESNFETTHMLQASSGSSQHLNPLWFAPFRNATTFRLLHWFWGSAPNKSIGDLQYLADNVLSAADFDKDDLAKFNAGLENKRLDQWLSNLDTSASDSHDCAHDGWIQTSVDIKLPTRTRHSSDSAIPLFTVPGLHYRPIVEVIKAAFMSPSALRFHYTPYRQFWQKNEDEPPQRVYDELFTANAWLKLHEDIQELPWDAQDKHERVIAGLMFWSDSTHLTNFGSASLWPLYMYFGNQSKYERSKPSSHACYHLAYFPKLPDSISDAFKSMDFGKLPTHETLTHCKRELMHALLAKVFDDNFKTASKSGLVIRCYDGITRRVFPRIMTYSADYPEKALLASIKFLSSHPCPRCLVTKSEAHRLGSKRNESIVRNYHRVDSHPQQISIENARRFIYKEGRGVKSVAVEAVLSPKSLVPTLNTFSKIMFPLGQNFYSIFVVDFLHEVELGLWKVIFIHLIRILTVCGHGAVISLNERYRLTATFGPDTIRKFTHDAASMKRMAARDYEDLLLCSMPAFEGLFPPIHDTIVQSLLFSLLNWHALAKLRIHTDRTIKLLDKAKHEVSNAIHKFQNLTCQAYETRELPSEQARREKREARASARKVVHGAGNSQTSMSQTPEVVQGHASPNLPSPDKRGKEKGKGKRKRKDTGVNEAKGNRRKRLNMNTYKAHAPDHYTHDIQEFGTLDSYSTQIGELEHRAVKKYYSRTNKRHAEEQITRIERREHALRKIATKDPSMNPESSAYLHTRTLARDHEKHYHISNVRRESIYLHKWLRENIYDPATKGFQRNLKNHFLGRLLNDGWGEDPGLIFTEADRNAVSIEYNKLYIHRVLRVNYTTYDGQRNQDTMNPRTRSDIMLLSQQEDSDNNGNAHPYRYARVIGIFHAVVRHKGPKSTTEGIPLKMDFLWVRWFARTAIPTKKLPSKGLDALTFLSADLDTDRFGFVDPNEVVRGIHLIPAFAFGKTEGLLCESIARGKANDVLDWKYYYINRFVDRDMYLRFVGGGIGHTLLELSIPESVDLNEENEIDLDSSEHILDPANDQFQRRLIYDENNDEVQSVDEDRDEDTDSDTASEGEEGEN